MGRRKSNKDLEKTRSRIYSMVMIIFKVIHDQEDHHLFLRKEIEEKGIN